MNRKLMLLKCSLLLPLGSCVHELSAIGVSEIVYSDVVIREDGELGSYVQATYPALSGSRAQSMLSEAIRDAVIVRFDEWRDFVITRSAKSAEGMKSEPDDYGLSHWGWRTEGTYFLGHLGETSVSLCMKEYGYTGGAHGNWSFFPINYMWDGDTVKEIIISDLFDGERPWMPRLDAAIRRGHITLLERRYANKDYVAEMKADLGGVPGMHRGVPFSFSSRGIVFYFAPYFLGSFVEGDFLVFVPTADIQDMLAPDGPMGRLLK